MKKDKPDQVVAEPPAALAPNTPACRKIRL